MKIQEISHLIHLKFLVANQQSRKEKKRLKKGKKDEADKKIGQFWGQHYLYPFHQHNVNFGAININCLFYHEQERIKIKPKKSFFLIMKKQWHGQLATNLNLKLALFLIIENQKNYFLYQTLRAESTINDTRYKCPVDGPL